MTAQPPGPGPAFSHTSLASHNLPCSRVTGTSPIKRPRPRPDLTPELAIGQRLRQRVSQVRGRASASGGLAPPPNAVPRPIPTATRIGQSWSPTGQDRPFRGGGLADHLSKDSVSRTNSTGHRPSARLSLRLRLPSPALPTIMTVLRQAASLDSATEGLRPTRDALTSITDKQRSNEQRQSSARARGFHH